MEEGEHPTAEELSKLRVVDLKARLTELGLPLNGVKKDLVERLHNHYVENAGEEGAEEEVGGVGSSLITNKCLLLKKTSF